MLNKYGHQNISTDCFILVRNSSFTEKYDTAIGVSIEKKTLCFFHLVDREENDNKALHQRSRGVKSWSTNVERGSEAKSENDILPPKAIALSEIRKRSSNSRKSNSRKYTFTITTYTTIYTNTTSTDNQAKMLHYSNFIY